MSSLDREAWFRRKTSLKVEMISDEAAANAACRGAASEFSSIFPPPSTVGHHMLQEHRKVVKDHGDTAANSYPK